MNQDNIAKFGDKLLIYFLQSLVFGPGVAVVIWYELSVSLIRSQSSMEPRRGER